MSAPETWAPFVNAALGNRSQAQVAREAGVDQSTINRWARGDRGPGDPPDVAAFAIACGENVIEAFVAAGYLTEAQAKLPKARKPRASSLSDEELLAAVAYRMERGQGRKGPAT